MTDHGTLSRGTICDTYRERRYPRLTRRVEVEQALVMLRALEDREQRMTAAVWLCARVTDAGRIPTLVSRQHLTLTLTLALTQQSARRT